MDIRFLDSLLDIAATDWDRLRPDDNPFLSHAFLAGLEAHGCLQPRWGWQPHHLVIHDGGAAVAAAPSYVKRNSHGEFVFDHAWAEAYHRHGLPYYPKLLTAVPYSPVSGPRLLGDRQHHPALLDALAGEARSRGWSGAHVNFVDADSAAAATGDRAWLPRHDWQFHWQDRGFGDFDGFLAALNSKKRKNIRHERAQVRAAGVTLRTVHGDEASARDIAAMHRFYVESFAAHGNLPVLTREFFIHIADALPLQCVLVLAERRGEIIAGALFLRSSTTLYGRYWGCTEPLPGLHFETCYYRGIEYCLAHGLPRFEPGAQGEHKIARGFLPVRTTSLHHIVDPRFRAAIADSLLDEADWLARYHGHLLAHSPYRAAG